MLPLLLFSDAQDSADAPMMEAIEPLDMSAYS